MADLDSRNMMQCDKIIYQICMVVWSASQQFIYICLAEHYVIGVRFAVKEVEFVFQFPLTVHQ
jgi:hypothetical protein